MRVPSSSRMAGLEAEALHGHDCGGAAGQRVLPNHQFAVAKSCYRTFDGRGAGDGLKT